jgi:NPCBM/NEW2 domain
MASNREEIVDSPTETPEAPKDHSDEREPSLASYATIVGIVTGLFGMLLTVGFILLPSATLHEKTLVIGASLAVSVAGLTGVGAWRSPRKFGLTMLAVGLAVACLVDLSMTAAGRTQATLRATSRPTPKLSTTPSPSPTETSSPPASASVSRTEAVRHTYSTQSPTTQTSTSTLVTGTKKPQHNGVSAPVYLSNQTGSPGSDQEWVAPVNGPWTINGTKYSQSLGYPNLCNKTTPVTYYLGKPYGHFLAETGIADHGAAANKGTGVTFTVYWKSGSGNFTLLRSASVLAGDPTLLDAPIPPGTTELQLTTTVMDAACMTGSTLVWGNARLVP